MHCAPDVNRAMRPGENLLDIQKGVAVHRLIGFASFMDMIGTLDVLKGQLKALLHRRCLLAARSPRAGKEELDPVDSRRFFWSVEAFSDVVHACRGYAPKPPQSGPMHLEFLLFSGLPVARYHKDRSVPLTAAPADRAQRWPEWMEQLRHLACAEITERREKEPSEESLEESFEQSQESEEVRWSAFWTPAAPRLGDLQVQATGFEALAASAEVTGEAVEKSLGCC